MSSESTLKLLKEFSPQLEKTSLTAKIWIGFLVGVLILGVVALIKQITGGHIVTGMLALLTSQ